MSEALRFIQEASHFDDEDIDAKETLHNWYLPYPKSASEEKRVAAIAL